MVTKRLAPLMITNTNDVELDYAPLWTIAPSPHPGPKIYHQSTYHTVDEPIYIVLP